MALQDIIDFLHLYMVVFVEKRGKQRRVGDKGHGTNVHSSKGGEPKPVIEEKRGKAVGFFVCAFQSAVGPFDEVLCA